MKNWKYIATLLLGVFFFQQGFGQNWFKGLRFSAGYAHPTGVFAETSSSPLSGFASHGLDLNIDFFARTRTGKAYFGFLSRGNVSLFQTRRDLLENHLSQAFNSPEADGSSFVASGPGWVHSGFLIGPTLGVGGQNMGLELRPLIGVSAINSPTYQSENGNFYPDDFLRFFHSEANSTSLMRTGFVPAISPEIAWELQIGPKLDFNLGAGWTWSRHKKGIDLVESDRNGGFVRRQEVLNYEVSYWKANVGLTVYLSGGENPSQ